MATILLIEDDPPVQRVLARMLERRGHSVHVAGDGRAGVRAFPEVRPELVITDMQMPEANGLEVILMLRSAAPAVPIIVMSGADVSGELDLLMETRLLGPVGRLAKPFTAADVLAAVNAALRARPDSNAGGAAG